MKIIPREIPAQQAWALRQAGVHPLLAQLYAARGVCSADELDDTPARLLAPRACWAWTPPCGCWPMP